ncbi:MAG TPA: hypothetical protein VGP80_00285 [Gemmatimonadales bacterium]|jgi:hypothetical protein|nr:hypothetical protein [Gemmatimonadales bacterium]
MLTSPTPHVIAVDWSGAAQGVRSKLWLSEVRGSTMTRLECGRDREELTEHLIELKRANPYFVVGLDFAFSFPQWFLETHGLTSAAQLWSLARFKVEEWLRDCPFPFWGKNNTRKPPDDKHFRWTESTVDAIGGVRPKSVFQVGGAGTVGTGTLRGLPHLKQLQEEGFSIWPFDEPSWPLVVEIYPRLLEGPVRKSNANERALYLEGLDPSIPAELVAKAIQSEDAFDAAISAMAIANEWYSLTKLTRTTDPVLQLEGLIWYPGCELVLR